MKEYRRTYLTNTFVRNEFVIFSNTDMGGNPCISNILKIKLILDILNGSTNSIRIGMLNQKQFLESITSSDQLVLDLI